ncbi:MAG: hypothetical protein U0T02_00110 [Solirubrobacteraceae bacterium]
MQGNLAAPGQANTGSLLTVLGGTSNADYVARSSNWVKIMISWSAIQNTDPGSTAKGSVPAFWNSLDQSPAWSYLDAQVKAANDRGVYVVLTLNCDGTPLWAADPDAVTRYNAVAPADRPLRLTQLPPASVDQSSWFAWFLSYVVARYKPGLGPGRRPWGGFALGAGNSLGAYMSLLEPLNEPNNLWWPQSLSGACLAAQVLLTAENVIHAWGQPPGGSVGLLGPATDDNITTTSERATRYDDFTQQVLNVLANWQPRVPVGWSHHNYADMRRYVTVNGQTPSARLGVVVAMLDAASQPWPGSYVWITEGGFAIHSGESEDLQRWAVYWGLTNGGSSWSRQLTQAQHEVWSDDRPVGGFDSGLWVYDSVAGTARERAGGWLAWDPFGKA